MQESKPSLFTQIVSIPAEIVVGLYVILDAIVAPAFRPLMRWLSTLRLMKRLEHWVASLPPYVILVLLVVPFAVAEFAKVFAVYLMGTGHFRPGITIFIGAYVVSILVCERTFHAGKGQLMTIKWFAAIYDWVMGVKDVMLGWFKRTRIWRLAGALRLKVRLTGRRLRTRVALWFGTKPSFEAKPKGSFERR